MAKDTFARDDGYRALSQRLVDLVLGALDHDVREPAPEPLSRAREAVRGELVDQVGAHLEELQQVNEELRVYEEELRLQQKELTAQNRDLREAQETVRAERRRYQELFDFAPDGYMVTDLAGCVREANRAASAYLGVSRAFLAGKPLILFVDPRDHDAFLSQLKRLEGGRASEVHNWRVRMRPRGGEPFTAEATVACVCDREGAPEQLRWLLRDVSERVQMEGRLRFQAQILDQVGDAVVAIDGRERVTYLNRRAREQYGLVGQEGVGSALSKLYEYRFLDAEEERAACAALAEGGRWRGRNFHVRQDGQELIVESTVTALDGFGHGPGLLATIRDITERVSVERERDDLLAQSLRLLQENQEQRAFLERLMEVAPIGIALVAGADHRYEYVNPYYRGIPGARDAPVVGRTFAEVFPEVAAGRALELFDQVRRTRQVVNARASEASLGPEGEHTYWNVDLVPLATGEGELSDVLILAHEVTDQVLSRRALEEERDLLNTIMDSTQAQISYLDAEFNFLRVNAAYCRGSGHAREELIGRNHFDLFPDDENRALFERVRDTGEAVSFKAKPFVYPDRPQAETTYWDWTLTPLKDAEDRVRGMVLSLHDVTEKEHVRARLRALIDVSQQVLAETSMEGVLERVVDAACELTGARIGTSGHGYREGVFQVRAAYHAEGLSPFPSGEAFTVEQGKILVDLIDDAGGLRLTDAELRAHPAWRLIPEGHPPLRGLLGAMLVDREGRANGLIMVSDKVDGEFTAEDEALLVQLASLASLATWHVEARTESERLRRRQGAILDSAGEGILGLDEEGRIVFANPATEAMTGWAAEDLIGKQHHDLMHHTKADGTPYAREECLVTVTLADGVSFGVSDEVFWRKDGSSFPVEYTSAPVMEGGEAAGAVLVFRDISEQLEAQRAIADLARFPGEDPSPVMRISREGVLLYANEGSQPLLAAWGVREGQQVPDGWREFLFRTDAVDADSVVEIPAGERTFALTVAPLERYVNLYGLDVTSLKRVEEALHRYAERLHVLNETGRAILAARTPQEISTVALSHARRLIPFRRASVTLFDADAGQMSLLAVHPAATEFERAWRRPLEEEAFLAELGEGQIHVVEDLDDLASPSLLAQTLQAQGVRAYASVPLIARDVLIGSLNLGMAAPPALHDQEIEIACEIADELAIGIQQARLLAQVQRHAEELERQVKRRTAALQISRARFQAVFEEAAMGIALVNRRGRILDSNPALQRMLGYSARELQGRVFSELAHPDNVTDDADLYQELIVGERTHYQVEGRYVRKDGRPIDANLIVSLVRPTKGRSRFAIALVEDVTARKQAQAALIESEKLALIGRMAASLAHEINNPLQSVIGCLSLAEEDMKEGVDALRYVEIALEELERAADLISRMRDLGRPPDVTEREPTDVNALLERVLTLTRKRCQEEHVEVEWQPAADLPRPSLLPDRMQQVFLNVVLNAVDAMPDGGRLRVCTAPTGESPGVQVRFEDSGTGIPADDLPHLFEPFYTTKTTGLGLGLYVSHDIVTAHDGRIAVESVEGEGTVFVVWLPARQED